MARKTTGRIPGRPVGETTAIIDARRVRQMLRDHLRLYRSEQRAIDAHAARERKKDPAWIMPDELLARLNMIGEWLVKEPNARKRNQEILDQIQDNQPLELVEAQFRHELKLAVGAWSDEDWADVDAERNKRFPGRWVPAEQEKAA